VQLQLEVRSTNACTACGHRDSPSSVSPLSRCCSIQWAETRVPVASIEGGSTFVMLQPAYSHSNNNGNLLPCFLENAFELLGDAEHGKPGDYYLDTKPGGGGGGATAVYFVGPTTPQRTVLPQSQGLVVATNISDWTVQARNASFAPFETENDHFTKTGSGQT
jgi:hypothetical protein